MRAFISGWWRADNANWVVNRDNCRDQERLSPARKGRRVALSVSTVTSRTGSRASEMSLSESGGPHDFYNSFKMTNFKELMGVSFNNINKR